MQDISILGSNVKDNYSASTQRAFSNINEGSTALLERRIGGEIQVHMPHSLVSPNSYKKRKEKHIERHETRLEGECLYRLYYDYTMYEADILIKGSCTKYIIYPILLSKLDINSKYICFIDRKKIHAYSIAKY